MVGINNNLNNNLNNINYLNGNSNSNANTINKSSKILNIYQSVNTLSKKYSTSLKK